MKIITILIAIFLFEFQAFTQSNLILKTGPSLMFYRNSEDPHTYLECKSNPTISFSIEYSKRMDNSAPLIGFRYKYIKYDKHYESGGLACSRCYQEEINSKIEMIEINANQKIFLTKTSPVYLQLGFYYSKTFNSFEKGFKIVPSFIETTDTSFGYWKFTKTDIESKSDYQNQSGLIIGVGFDWLINRIYGLNISTEFRPFLEKDFKHSLFINIGIIWIINNAS